MGRYVNTVRKLSPTTNMTDLCQVAKDYLRKIEVFNPKKKVGDIAVYVQYDKSGKALRAGPLEMFQEASK